MPLLTQRLEHVKLLDVAPTGLMPDQSLIRPTTVNRRFSTGHARRAANPFRSPVGT